MNDYQKRNLEKLPSHGKYGGPLVGVKVFYEDGSEFVLHHDHPLIKSITEDAEPASKIFSNATAPSAQNSSCEG